MNTASEQYLSTVNRHLKPLPISERIDIVKEIKSTLLELEHEGLSEEQSIERLGDPKELAKSYLADLLTQRQPLSLTRFLTVFAFYSVTGFSGLFIIPVLGVAAPSFLFCGILSLLAGAVKLLDYLLKLELPFAKYIRFEFNSMALNPIPAFFFSIGVSVILSLIGYGSWKLLQFYCRKVGKAKKKLQILK